MKQNPHLRFHIWGTPKVLAQGMRPARQVPALCTSVLNLDLAVCPQVRVQAQSAPLGTPALDVLRFLGENESTGKTMRQVTAQAQG